MSDRKHQHNQVLVFLLFSLLMTLWLVSFSSVWVRLVRLVRAMDRSLGLGSNVVFYVWEERQGKLMNEWSAIRRLLDTFCCLESTGNLDCNVPLSMASLLVPKYLIRESCLDQINNPHYCFFSGIYAVHSSIPDSADWHSRLVLCSSISWFMTAVLGLFSGLWL